MSVNKTSSSSRPLDHDYDRPLDSPMERFLYSAVMVSNGSPLLGPSLSFVTYKSSTRSSTMTSRQDSTLANTHASEFMATSSPQ